MPQVKLGKLPARYDRRTIRLMNVLRALPAPPIAYDIDQTLPAKLVDSHMYGNNIYGDCVIAARAHQTLRFEDVEQKLVLPITDKEVEDEYFKETGGPDVGLVMLDSLNAWRRGWTAGGKAYDIYAYGSLTPTNVDEIKWAIQYLGGANIGVQVPQSALDQFDAGQIWDVVPNDGGIQGGHDIVLVAYDSLGPTCMTWGRKQKMTWAWLKKYCDEAYGIVDNRDSWLGSNSPVDVNALDRYLAEITSGGNTVAKQGSGTVDKQDSAGEVVTVVVMRPDGQSDTLTAQTDGQGNYTVQYTPPAVGKYSSEASIGEDADYLAAQSPVIDFEMVKAGRAITLGWTDAMAKLKKS